MKKIFEGFVPIALALGMLSFTQSGCGDSNDPAPPTPGGASDPVVAPSPSPTSTPSPSLSPSPSPSPSRSPIVLKWLQDTYKTTCEATENVRCLGFYGFTVTAQGTYKVGPGPMGQTITGALTASEEATITRDSNAILTRSVQGPPFCVDSVSIPGVTNRVTMKLSTGKTVDVYHQKLGSTCYLNDVSTNTKLQSDLFVLMQKYYPIPFPAPPVPMRVKSGHWGGEGATLDVTFTASKLQLDCAHGNIPGPIFLNSGGRFNRHGRITFEGGPEPIGGRPSHPAEFKGTVNGEKMDLDVEFMQDGRSIEAHFTLTFGSPGVLHRCL